MLRNTLLAALASVALAFPAAAATVFSTDFSADTPALNAVPAGFSVTGQVDIVGASSPYGIVTPGGNVVDLDGTPGPGKLTSLSTYAFGAGDRVELTFLLGGAQRGSASDSIFAQLIFGFATAVTDFSIFGWLGSFSFPNIVLSDTFTANSFMTGADPFVATGLSFTAVNAGSLAFAIGTDSNDNVGPLLAGVTLDVTPPAPIPLPAAGAALMLGLGLLAGLRRRRA
jgi:MYXO-CTERM domain-containing protein